MHEYFKCMSVFPLTTILFSCEFKCLIRCMPLKLTFYMTLYDFELLHSNIILKRSCACMVFKSVLFCCKKLFCTKCGIFPIHRTVYR